MEECGKIIAAAEYKSFAKESALKNKSLSPLIVDTA